uniref:Uncharacterized protein n=1 Tax=Mycena chlorophos TaxID=658473 RepID=A0ABQ0L197_MYCCL|nr:predicted protein [Mycena chlorophos]
MLSDPDVVRMCNEACDKAWDAVQSAMATDPPGRMSPEEVNNVFEAEFLRTFEGPVPEQLFINREGRMRLAFEILLDFFNPHGMRKRGNHDSVGILALVNLNLPEDIRYKPEFMWLSILLGPHEPDHDQIGGYLRPVIDKFVEGWKRGIRLSRIGGNDAGCIGSPVFAPTTFALFATAKRDVGELRRWAEAWRDAKSQAERDTIFAAHGVRWSEFWRLPYWDPTRMGVIDSMHCILEGLVHYFCRYVLRIDAEVARKREGANLAFDHDWVEYDPDDCPADYLLEKQEKESAQIHRIHNKLMLSLDPLPVSDAASNVGADDVSMPDAPRGNIAPTISEEKLWDALHGYNRPALRFVAFSLNLDVNPDESKAQYCDKLVAWRRTKPRSGAAAFVPKSINLAQIKFIQRVIEQTATPSWVNSVPHNYGESNAGSIKADEWRTLATLYLPIALVLLWGDQSMDAQSARLFGVLDHAMCLFNAVDLVCRYTMTAERALKYREFLKIWVDGLTVHHPHTHAHAKRPNIHVAFHIYDFLLLFGPVISWWCFPFERMIGYLQQIHTTNRIGGELEGILTTSYFRGAALRRWLRRPDCPEIVQQFKALFDRAFTPRSQVIGTSPPLVQDGDRAHFTYRGVNFSRASAHLGNSLVLYSPAADAATPIAGSIVRIVSQGAATTFSIRRQALLPAGSLDPFARYHPYFPAVTYSSEMQDTYDDVDPSQVLAHCARFEFSEGRAVVVNLSRS